MKEKFMKSRAIPIRAIIIPLAMIYAALLLLSALGLEREAESSAALLQAEINELRSENERLEYYIEHSDDDSVLAEIAESELGLTDTDSVIFYDMSHYGG